MKKKFYGILVLVLLTLTACGQKNTEPNSNQKINSSNSTESIDEKKSQNENYSDKRVIAASKTVAEYLSLFNQKLVGIAKQENLPDVYKDVEKVGSPRKLNLELMISLKPDLVIANETSRKDIEESLSSQNIETFFIDSSSYDSVFENIELVGEKLGQSEKSNDIVKDLKSNEKKLLDMASPLKGKKVAILFGTGDNFQLMTKNTYIGDLLNLLGIENIAEDNSGENAKYLPYSLENIVSSNPDYILTLAHGNKEQAEKIFSEEFEKDLWENVDAVKNNRLIHLDDEKYPVTGNIHVMETLEGLINLLLEK